MHIITHSNTKYYGNSCFLSCLSFLLQTFVNDVRIQEQMYITLKLEDKLRFGYDILSLFRSVSLFSPSHNSTDILSSKAYQISTP